MKQQADFPSAEALSVEVQKAASVLNNLALSMQAECFRIRETISKIVDAEKQNQ